MRKQSFLLLEVLLAITIIALFAAPLIRYPIQYYRTEIDQLEKFEMQRLADWTFTEIKEKLLKEEIPWEQLPEKGQSIVRSLPDETIRLPSLSSRTIHRSFTLKCKGEKTGIHGEIFRLYSVKVKLGSFKPFAYRILIQRIPS